MNNENRYENSKQQTIDTIYLPNISGHYHGTSTSAAVGGKLGDFYRQESSFKGRHRHFGGRYRTLFNINVHFK